MEVKHAYRYLHFKVISVQFDPDVGDGLLEEPGRPQNQNQLQVPGKCPLCHTALVTLCQSQSVFKYSFQVLFYFSNTLWSVALHSIGLVISRKYHNANFPV